MGCERTVAGSEAAEGRGDLVDVRRPYLAMRRNNQKTARFDDLLKDEYIIMLLQGRSTNGEMIYCYLKVYMPDIDRFKERCDPMQISTPLNLARWLRQAREILPPK